MSSYPRCYVNVPICWRLEGRTGSGNWPLRGSEGQGLSITVADRGSARLYPSLITGGRYFLPRYAQRQLAGCPSRLVARSKAYDDTVRTLRMTAPGLVSLWIVPSAFQSGHVVLARNVIGRSTDLAKRWAASHIYHEGLSPHQR